MTSSHSYSFDVSATSYGDFVEMWWVAILVCSIQRECDVAAAGFASNGSIMLQSGTLTEGCQTGGGPTRLETKVILSSHDFEGTPDDDALRRTVAAMWASGADVAKVAATARDVSDARRMLALLEEQSGGEFCSGPGLDGTLL